MSDRIRLPTARDVQATLDAPGRGEGPDACVVACPPHPQMGGDRRDSRLRAVSDALTERGVACLRFDYGPWDEGLTEQRDARDALAWAREDYETVGLFGYSFGGAVAILAAASESEAGTPPAALSALSPAAALAGETVADAVAAVDCPLQIVYGERDDTVDPVPVAERAREAGHAVEAMPADHFFVGRQNRAASAVVDFLAESLR